MQTRSIEDYIKGIYKLQNKEKPVSTSVLAKYLGIGDGSVTDMLKKLSGKKLVRYEPYQGVTLTEAGRRLAMTMVRRHRIWEMFLVRYLGYAWDEVHDEAERLEHATSDEMERRLDALLGYPSVDPHGDPIPTPDGKIHGTISLPLSEFDNGDRVVILRVSDDHPEILQHASKLGLTLAADLEIRDKTPFDGSMIVRIGRKDRFISRRVAESIFVEPYDARKE